MVILRNWDINTMKKDLFLMALRNGLEDRTYADWTRTQRAFIKNPPTYEVFKGDYEKEFVGVGSVLRMIPGVDICSGGEITLIGGMKIINETIKFNVKYPHLPLWKTFNTRSS